jgi:hypothetical protein
MVISPTSVTSPSASVSTWPSVTPIAMKISENSLICATVSPARKPVRAVAQRHHDREHDQRIADQHEQRQHAPPRARARRCWPRSRLVPSAMKKNSSRKSRSGAEARGDRIAERRRGQRDAGEQPAELLAEAERLAGAAKAAASAMAKPISSSGDLASRSVSGSAR